MNVTPLDLLILALFTWRLAYLIAREDAPFNLMGRLRSRYPLGMRGDDGTYCLKCVSVWSAALGYLLWLSALPLLQAAVIVGAVSGAALMLASYSGVNHG